MRVERVALIPKCAAYGRRWLPDAEDRSQAHVDEDLDETAELFLYCLECAEREFDYS